VAGLRAVTGVRDSLVMVQRSVERGLEFLRDF
jgi:hypothetical protein